MRRVILALSAVLGGAILASTAQPCTRVLWNDNNWSVLVGRNMDWFEDLKSNIWALPRGMKRDGLAAKNPLVWTSKYGSIAITGYEEGTVDGLNEKGLGAHLLYLPETSTSPRNERVPGLCISLWAQYYLDQFATVDEAVKALKTIPYQLLMAIEPSTKRPLTLHLALNDAAGDSAILECIHGEIKVYHDRKYTVLTNEPQYDQQLELLKQYHGFGGEKRLPGTHEPTDRFVRASYYLKNLPKPKADREAIAALMSVMRNVSAPFGSANVDRPEVSTTIWRIVTDLTNRIVYYDGVFSPQVFWVKMRELNLAEGQPVLKLTVVDNFDLMGDVSGEFRKSAMFKFLGPE